jgi:DNA polymerase-1
MRKVLLMDTMNLFIRCFAAFPQMNVNGEQIGGCIGFLKTLRRLVADISPSHVYAIWESGGSQRRRKLLPEYKMNRKPERLNRFYGDDIPESDENRQLQMSLLLQILRTVPVCQIYVPNCEGDDVIGYLSHGRFKDTEKVIASSDKDMYQLLDDKTTVYNFHKKTFVTHQDVFEDLRIKTFNFAIAKAICGDPGDNVPGIKGVGFKTVAKRIPLLGGETEVTLDEVHAYCTSHLGEAKIYRDIVEGKNDIVRNWRLVYLDGSMLSASQISKIDTLVDTFKPNIDKMALIKHLAREGVNDFDADFFTYSFRCIDDVQFVNRSGK